MNDATNRDPIIATVKENVSLSVFDAASGEIVAAIPVHMKDISKPHEIAVTRDGTLAFVSLYGDKDYGSNTPDNRLGIVDLRDFSFAGHMDLGLYKGPHAMMTDRDGKIWVTVDPNRCVLIIARTAGRSNGPSMSRCRAISSPRPQTAKRSISPPKNIPSSSWMSPPNRLPVGFRSQSVGKRSGYLRMAQSFMSGICTGLCFMSSIGTAVNYWKRFRLPACRAGRSTAPTGNL